MDATERHKLRTRNFLAADRDSIHWNKIDIAYASENRLLFNRDFIVQLLYNYYAIAIYPKIDEAGFKYVSVFIINK